MRPMTAPPEVRLKTPRLTLRPVAEADLDDIVEGIGDFAVASRLARVPHPYRRDDAEAFLAATRDNAGRNIALSIDEGGRVIGGLGLTGLRREREFGYWLARPYWGKGYATEASLAFLAYLFGPPGLDIVRSGVFVGNAASLRVQDKLGFTRTGTRLVHCLAQRKDIEHIDTILARAHFLALHPGT